MDLPPPAPFLFAQGFAPGEERPFVADLDGDGYADFLTIPGRPEGEVWLVRNERGQRAHMGERGPDGIAVAAEPACVGDFDGNRRADIAALAGDGTVRLALAEGHGFRKVADAGTAPAAGAVRLLAADADGDGIDDIFVLCGGEVFLLRADGRGALEPARLLGRAPDEALAADVTGDGRADLVWEDGGTLRFARGDGTGRLGEPADIPLPRAPGRLLAAARGVLATAGAWVVFDARGRPSLIEDARLADVPGAASGLGDIDGDGAPDFVTFSRRERCDVTVSLFRGPDWEAGTPPLARDRDADGLTDFEEVFIYGTDPCVRDTDHDGLLDGWEAKGSFRGVRLDRMGANPLHRDIFLELDVEEGADMERVARAIARMKKLFAEAPVDNPDGKRGIAMHCEVDTRVPIWAENAPDRHQLRELFFTPNRAGIFHWMHLAARGGGGQADLLADQGSCAGVFEATLPHEFGHELGLNHGGHDGMNGIPHYPSLMNYAYNYQLGGSLEATGYSRGVLASLALDERALPERLEVPEADVRYLAGPPFFFRLEPREGGKAVWIDWNRNAREDEKPVRANINAAAGEGYGRREILDRIAPAPEPTETTEAPVLVACAGKLVLLYVPKGAPGLAARVLAESDEPEKFGPPRRVLAEPPLAELAAAADGAEVVAFARAGDALVEARGAPDAATWTAAVIVTGTAGFAPACAASPEEVFLVVRTPEGALFGRRRPAGAAGPWTEPRAITLTSAVPPGLAWDPIARALVLVTTDAGSNRLRCSRLDPHDFSVRATELVGGLAGGDATTQRPAVLFETGPDVEPAGRVDIFVSGATDWSKPGAWAHMFRCYTIGDKEWRGRDGWKCDMTWNEWSYTTAGPGAAWYAGRPWEATRFYTFWAGGTQWNDRVTIAPNADGICDSGLRDCDDWEIITSVGLERSILQAATPTGKR